MKIPKISKKNRKYFIIFILCASLFCLLTLFLSKTYNHNIFKGIYLLTIVLFLVTILFFILYKFQKKQIHILLCFFFSICMFVSSSACIYRTYTYEDVFYHGIDISKWDGEVDLSATTLDFVIIRCGYTSNEDGLTIKPDSQFEQNIKQCKELGIPYGVYYYSCATDTTQAVKEANYTLSVLKDDIPPLGVYYDTEDPKYQQHLPTEQLTKIALSYLEVVEAKGHDGGVYANYYWWNNKLDQSMLDDYLKWIAIYDEEYIIEDQYQIHQYRDDGTVNGLSGEFDVNITKNKFWLD